MQGIAKRTPGSHQLCSVHDVRQLLYFPLTEAPAKSQLAVKGIVCIRSAAKLIQNQLQNTY
jgi:hypothetical protein